jgi:hypothetical protein
MQSICRFATPLACLNSITPQSVYARVREELETPPTSLTSAAASWNAPAVLRCLKTF